MLQRKLRTLSHKTPCYLFVGVFLILIYLLYISISSSSETDLGSRRKRIDIGAIENDDDKGPAHLTTAISQRTSVLNQQTPPQLYASGKNNQTRLKTILYWNEFYGRFDTYDFGYGHEPFRQQCGTSHHRGCFATKDRQLLGSVDQFDAIVIHIRGLPNDWPDRRRPEQRYVMLAIDAPIYLYEYRDLRALSFNWTMTYRLDSDFPIPYAWVDQTSPLPAPLGSTVLQSFISKFGKRAAKKGPNLAEGKVGLAVQFVSNCHSSSAREVYTRELQRHISVDIYGKCGEFTCPKEKGWECYRMAESKYKFFLSFEDALCRDYVTERFFSLHGLNVVPVVLGGSANYSRFAPFHSFIDASEFESPQALAHYLKILDADDAKFNEYFWWRDYYKRRFRHHQAMCDLCDRLHRDKETKTYQDMHQWWLEEAACKKTGVLESSWMNS